MFDEPQLNCRQPEMIVMRLQFLNGNAPYA